MIYLADETITVVHFDKSEKQYVCTAVSGVSWKAKVKRQLSGTDVPAREITVVRIPEENMPEGLTLRQSDFVCKGSVTGIERRSDLETYEYFMISEVRNNCRGTHLRHWAVMSE